MGFSQRRYRPRVEAVALGGAALSRVEAGSRGRQALAVAVAVEARAVAAPLDPFAYLLPRTVGLHHVLYTLAHEQLSAKRLLNSASQNCPMAIAIVDSFVRGAASARAPTARFIKAPSETDARSDLLKHLQDVIRALSATGLLFPAHRPRSHAVLLDSFAGAAQDLFRPMITRHEGVRFGDFMRDSALYCAVEEMILLYKEPKAGQKMVARLKAYKWQGTVQASKQMWEALMVQAREVARETAHLHGLARFPEPDWTNYLTQYLQSKLPVWVLDLQVQHASEFDTSQAFWDLLEIHEPSTPTAPGRLHALLDAPPPSEPEEDDFTLWASGPWESRCSAAPVDAAASLLAMARPGAPFARNRKPVTCWRCNGFHYRRDCKATPSVEEDQGLPPEQWPVQPPHPDQARDPSLTQVPRPPAAPVPYARPSVPSPHPASRTYVTSRLQALPAVDDARLLALEQGQAQITAMLQQVLLQSSSPPATAVAMGPAAGLASMSTSSLPVPEALPTIATMSSTPVTSRLSDLPPLVVAATAPGDYTDVGVSHPDRQGAGQTLWMRNDLLDQAMMCAVETPETKNDQGAH